MLSAWQRSTLQINNWGMGIFVEAAVELWKVVIKGEMTGVCCVNARSNFAWHCFFSPGCCLPGHP